VTRYGFDLHGVIDKEVGFYLWYFETLIEEGKEVWVVSGPPTREIEAELFKLGFLPGQHYTKVESVVDFLTRKRVKMWQDEKNTWWASEEDWWSSKAKICEENEIEVMFDNSGKYAPYFDAMGIKFELI